MNEKFEKELQHLINKYSVDNDLNVADYILAKYIIDCLETLNNLMLLKIMHEE